LSQLKRKLCSAA